MATSTLSHLPPFAERFESVYAEAQGDPSRIPWAHLRPNPALVNWLNAVAPSLIRCGARVLVVGCGLGDDARELLRRGYDVTAFDCSATAIEWARQRDPEHAHYYVQADLFQPQPRWRHRFDLVVEINTIQSLPPDLQPGAMSAIADLASPRGYVLAICRAATTQAVAPEDGPPWPLTEAQLLEYAALAGLKPVEPVSVFEDDQTPPVMRMRALFSRG